MNKQHGTMPENYHEAVEQFPRLIEPINATIMDSHEKGFQPAAMALAAIAAGRDAIAELWGAEFAVVALRMALEAFVEANPEAAQVVDDAKRRAAN